VKIANPELQARLEQLAQQGLDLVKHNMIWQEAGRYHVFGEYEISVTKQGVDLACRRRDPQRFSSVKSALAWCIAHKFQRLDVAQEISELDQRRQIDQADIEVRSQLARRHSNADRREMSMLKVEQRRQQLELTELRLDKCINLAKYWQIRGFNNETARTGRSASQRTSRPGI
jgi:hypothetical protein